MGNHKACPDSNQRWASTRVALTAINDGQAQGLPQHKGCPNIRVAPTAITAIFHVIDNQVFNY